MGVAISPRLLATLPSGVHLVHGRILPLPPRDAAPFTVPDELEISSLREARDVVMARIDIEETAPYGRPVLLRFDLGRDFVLADESGRAIVRVGESGPHLHPDVELHLDGPFTESTVEKDEILTSTYLRTVHAGDPVYVFGRARLEPDPDAAGYRDAPLVPVFAPAGLLHIYDAPAFEQLAAWRALPWYRKLSVLVRNR
jgi:hypothetical protein